MREVGVKMKAWRKSTMENISQAHQLQYTFLRSDVKLVCLKSNTLFKGFEQCIRHPVVKCMGNAVWQGTELLQCSGGWLQIRLCVYLCMCGNTCCCANSRREKLYISISWHNCCNLKFVDKLFIHEFFKLYCTFLSHLAYCIFRYITDHSLMEIITELHKKTTQYFSPIYQESLELILKTWRIISLYIYTYISFSIFC